MRNAKFLSTVVIVCLALASSAMAEPDSLWSKVYSWGDQCRPTALVQAPGGGFFLAGQTNDNFVVKLSEGGDSLWSVSFGGELGGEIADLAATTDSGVLAVGRASVELNGNSVMHLLKTDQNGGVVWEKNFLADSAAFYPVKVFELQGGVILVAGSYWRQGNNDIYLMGISQAGEVEWVRLYGTQNYESISSAALTADGGVVMAGTSAGLESEAGMILKINSAHELVWLREYPANAMMAPFDIVATSDGGAAALTMVIANQTQTPGLMKIDSAGAVVWNRAFESEFGAAPNRLMVKQDGAFNFIATKFQSNEFANHDFWLVMTDNQGEHASQRAFGGEKVDECVSFCKTAENGYLLAGTTKSFGRPDTMDVWLLKIGEPNSVKPSDLPLLPVSITVNSWPSPFNSTAVVTFSTPFNGFARATLTDLAGREVMNWGEFMAQPGESRLVVNGADLSTGMYWFRIEQAGRSAGTRIVLVR